MVKSLAHIWPWKFKDQGHCQGQIHWSHLRPGVHSICLLIVLWWADLFWLKYSKFHIWPWKFKVKLLAKVKPECQIWGLKFNWYVCFSFRGGDISGWLGNELLIWLQFYYHSSRFYHMPAIHSVDHSPVVHTWMPTGCLGFVDHVYGHTNKWQGTLQAKGLH